MHLDALKLVCALFSVLDSSRTSTCDCTVSECFSYQLLLVKISYKNRQGEKIALWPGSTCCWLGCAASGYSFDRACAEAPVVADHSFGSSCSLLQKLKIMAERKTVSPDCKCNLVWGSLLCSRCRSAAVSTDQL